MSLWVGWPSFLGTPRFPAPLPWEADQEPAETRLTAAEWLSPLRCSLCERRLALRGLAEETSSHLQSALYQPSPR